MALITAGFTFNEMDYPNEFGYCIRTLTAIARETGFSALLDVTEILHATHKDTSCNGDWSKGFQSRVAASPGIRWEGNDYGFGNLDLEGLRAVF